MEIVEDSAMPDAEMDTNETTTAPAPCVTASPSSSGAGTSNAKPTSHTNVQYHIVPAQGPIVESKFCVDCGSPFHLGGPIWTQPLHDIGFVRKVIDHIIQNQSHYSSRDRMLGMLRVVEKELPDSPLFFQLPSLMNRVHCASPKIDVFRSALLNAGYHISRTHIEPDAIKTDAPSSVIWDIVRCWVKAHPVSDRRKSNTTSPGSKILAIEPSIQADFTVVPEAADRTRAYFPNPEENWGPKSRAKSRKRNTTEASEAHSNVDSECDQKRQKTSSAEQETANKEEK